MLRKCSVHTLTVLWKAFPAWQPNGASTQSAVCPLCRYGHQLHKAHQHVLAAFQPQMLLPPHNSLILVAVQEGQLLAVGPMHAMCTAPGLPAPQLSVLITTSVSASAYHQLLLWVMQCCASSVYALRCSGFLPLVHLPITLFFSHQAVLCSPIHPITLQLLLWQGLDPCLQHPHCKTPFLTHFFSPGSIFAQVGSTLAAVLMFRDTAAPTCLPSRRGGWLSLWTPCAKCQETASASSSFQTMPKQS